MKAFMINCIFHNDIHPSLRIFSNGYFKCYGCEINGSIEEHHILENIFKLRIFLYLEKKGQLLIEY